MENFETWLAIFVALIGFYAVANACSVLEEALYPWDMIKRKVKHFVVNVAWPAAISTYLGWSVFIIADGFGRMAHYLFDLARGQVN